MVNEGRNKSGLQRVCHDNKHLIRVVRGLLRSGILLLVMFSVVALTITTGYARVISEGDPAASVAAQCPCKGACGTPTVTPSPVQQIVDTGKSAAEQLNGYQDSGGNPAQPSTSTANLQTESGIGSGNIAGQAVSNVPAGQVTADKLDTVASPSIFGSSNSGIGEFPSAKFKSFTPSWLINGETSGQMSVNSKRLDLSSFFDRPRFTLAK